jgi:uncharacterized protein YegP (UPF0339 family)
MKIETFTDDNNETRFRVVAANGQIVLTPHEGYTRKADCHRAIVDNFAAIVDGVMGDGMIVVDEDGTEQRLMLRREPDKSISLYLQE